MDHTRNPGKQRETNVDQEISATSALDRDTERWEEEREEVEADVRA